MKWLDEIFFTSGQITEKKILLSLLRVYRNKNFVHPLFTDENFAFGRVRLTSFRSDAEWMMVFEYLVYIAEADVYSNIVECYGNKIKRHHYSSELFQLISYNDDEDVNPLEFDIVIHSTKRHFHYSYEEYLKNGIDLKKAISNDRIFDNRMRVLRMLVYSLPLRDIFLSTSDLLKLTGRPSTLPVFLQLYEWHHPDPRVVKDKFLTPCLQSLVKALADDNPESYECEQGSINTHWSAWPSFGLR